MEFLACIEAALSSISRNPELHSAVHDEVRRALVRRFPYGVFYIVEQERIVVLAVFHGHRDPTELMRRLGLLQ
jgi:plasmid stabilization system protein ParE